MWVGLWDWIDYCAIPSTGFAKLVAAVAGIALLFAAGALYEEPNTDISAAFDPSAVTRAPFHGPGLRWGDVSCTRSVLLLTRATGCFL